MQNSKVVFLLEDRLSIIGFYKHLLCVLCAKDDYDSDDKVYGCVSTNLSHVIKQGLSCVSKGDLRPYNPKSHHFGGTVVFDVLLMMKEMFDSRTLEKMLRTEYVILLCNMSLAVNEKVPSGVVARSREESYYIHVNYKLCKLDSFFGGSGIDDKDGENRKIVELLSELLYACYYAVFIKHMPIGIVRKYYVQYSEKLSRLNSCSPSLRSKLLLEYTEVFCDMKNALGCEGNEFLEIDTEVPLFLILIKYLLVNVSLPEHFNSTSCYFFEGCRQVNEIKAQQAAMMMLKACQSFDGAKKGGITYVIIMKLLFGNFLERNLILKIFDIFHISFCNASGSESSLVSLAEDLYSVFCSTLPLVACLQNELPMDCSDGALESMDLNSCELHDRAFQTAMSYAVNVLNISAVSLREMQYKKYNSSFINLLSCVVTRDTYCLRVASPCSGLSEEECDAVVSIASSYVRSYVDNPTLFDARICSMEFLVFCVLTHPELVSSFALLYNGFFVNK
ncbi:MAG: hypothetical protein ACTJLM_01495 [Ehrlichia sp.]